VSGTWALIGGLAACYAAIGGVIFTMLSGRRDRVVADRRSPIDQPTTNGQLGGSSQRLIGALKTVLARSKWNDRLTEALASAGKRTAPVDFLVLLLAAALVGAATGLVLSGWVLALVLMLAVPLLAKIVLGFLAGRRRAAFSDQLDNTLQLLAGSLRAGHSLLRAVDAVSREAEPPTTDEFARILNETRVGRELGDSLDATAARMSSDDFGWVAQAIAIHRDVGGDLSEVLDTVAHTIRERNQIRRQVKALSAEGRLSGIVLMLLPVGVAGFLTVINPGYLGKLTHNAMGWTLIATAIILITVGGLWLRKVVSFRF